MAKYTIFETQNLNSVRAGETYEGTLRGAKAYATKNQIWQGTVLKIANEQGTIVAIKDQSSGTWYNPADFE